MGKRIGMWLFILVAAGVATLNLYALARGIATGGIATLHKNSDAIIWRATAPGTFMVNVGLRALIAMIFGGWSAVLARGELRSGHRN